MEYRKIQDKSMHNQHLKHTGMQFSDEQQKHLNNIAIEKIQMANDNMEHEEKMKQKYKEKLYANMNRKAGEPGMSPIDYFRAQCLSRGVTGIRGLGRLFRIMDDDRSKSLTVEELTNGLRDYGLTLTKQQVSDMFARIDVDGTGTISYDEFLVALRPPMSSARMNIIEQAFAKLDTSGDEFITVEDLQGKYDVSQHPKFKNGEWTKERCLRQFLDTFDVGGVKDGRITYEEFVNYYSGVSASIDDDAYFDLMMRNAFKF